jgi:ABC-2 type transport system ATP-binding protein
MKQKIEIVCAFMHGPDILILDEPTSGLDPLMQATFIELIREEKERGKSIFIPIMPILLSIISSISPPT